MPAYDASRLADVRYLEGKLANPSLAEPERKKIENALYGIKHQAQFKSIRKLRDQMTTAVQSGNRELQERVSAEAKRIDRDYKG